MAGKDKMNTPRRSAGSWPFAESSIKVEALLTEARDRLVTISDTAQLTQAAARLGEGRTDLVLVCDATGRMVGVVSKTDIVSRIGQCAGHACTTMVASVMTRNVASCRPTDSLQSAWVLMKEKGYLHIPVIDEDEHPLGTLYARDALQTLLGEVEYEEDLLRDYVTGIGYR